MSDRLEETINTVASLRKKLGANLFEKSPRNTRWKYVIRFKHLETQIGERLLPALKNAGATNGQQLDALKCAEERFRSLNLPAQRQPGRRPDAPVRLRFLRLGRHTLSGTSASKQSELQSRAQNVLRDNSPP